jgi:hypothetical protein
MNKHDIYSTTFKLINENKIMLNIIYTYMRFTCMLKTNQKNIPVNNRSPVLFNVFCTFSGPGLYKLEANEGDGIVIYLAVIIWTTLLYTSDVVQYFFFYRFMLQTWSIMSFWQHIQFISSELGRLRG